MNCKFTNALMFAAGAAIGSAVTWKIVKDKYRKIADEEIESIKEVFANRDGKSVENPEQTHKINWSELEDLDEEEDDECDATEDDLREYETLTNNYSSEKGGVTMAKRPYVISPDEFGEIDEYHRISLRYYADGVLEDDEGNIIEDIDELLGDDPSEHFGEYEDDSVFVRNEYLETDFEILKDPYTYTEANGIYPVQVDGE